MVTVKDYFLIMIPSLSLCIALYTLLSNNKKFREFSKRLWSVVMLQLNAVLNCTGLLIVDYLSNKSFSNSSLIVINIVGDVLTYIMFISFLLSWLILCKEFFYLWQSISFTKEKILEIHLNRLLGFMKSFFIKHFMRRTIDREIS